jgi:hypothetical protein
MKEEKYRDPKIVKRIYYLRSVGTHFNKITAMINDEFGVKMSSPTLKKVYLEYVARQNVIESTRRREREEARDVTKDYQAKMQERYDKIAKVTDDLIDMLVGFKDEVDPILYVKLTPQILSVCREILNQLSFIKKENEQILVNQKNVIYSPLQIMNVLNKEMGKLEKEKRIIIPNMVSSVMGSGNSKSEPEEGRILPPERKENLVIKPKNYSEEDEESQY